MRRFDGTIFLLERSGTGYADGQLCPPSGHLEAGDTVAETAAMGGCAGYPCFFLYETPAEAGFRPGNDWRQKDTDG